MSTSTGDPTRRGFLYGLAGVGAGAALGGCTTGSAPAHATASASHSVGTPVARSTPTTTRPSPAASLESLSRELSSPLLRPGSVGYDAAARLYNPRFDRNAGPAAIARCASVADVAACVRFSAGGAGAAGPGQPLRLRAGGHSYGGWSTGPGLVADVRAMSSVVLDRTARTARIGAGAKLAKVYAALGAAGVAIAAGSCPTVGLTGLTLGGGVGVLTRAYGLTCDALRAAEVVTADGRIREVGPGRDGELFWALQGGGGGSFGAVTALTLAVRPAPTVHTFFLSWDLAQADAVLPAWQPWMSTADDRLWSTCKLLVDPGRQSCKASVSGTWIGAASSLQSRLEPLLSAIGAPPRTRQVGTSDYAAAMLAEAGCSGQDTAQCIAQALSPAGRQPFAATSAFLNSALPAAGITAAVRAVLRGTDVAGLVEGGMFFDALGGAVSAVAPGATAFAYRQALASIQYTATWAAPTGGAQPADPAPYDRYVQALRSALLPWTGPAAYVNYADPAIADYGAAYWAGNYPRLQAAKKTYDPGGLFTFPQAVHA